jgi:hypothetical protein
VRERIQQHWEASERGDVDAEHAIYAGDAIHETQYFADPSPASPGRTALAEPIPAREQ